MRYQRLLLTIIFVVFCFSIKSKAQINVAWQPMYLTVSGSNLVDGVEGFFAQSSCNSEPVILIKFVNHNTYDVKISWYDGVFLTDNKWLNKSDIKDLKKLQLNAEKELAGDCSGTNPLLMIKIMNELGVATKFKRYNANSLVISVN